MNARHRRPPPVGASAVVVVIGASEAMGALQRLVAQFPKDFPGAVFIAHHMSADTDGETLRKALDKASPLGCRLARDNEKFENGRIYLAPPDHHLLVGKDRIKVTKGARENRQRPAIDPLFRSAAVAHGDRVIGIILSGYLDDGTAGMEAIKRCGGTCVVQDPDEADYPDMVLNVLAQVEVDHRVSLAEMGATLATLAGAPSRNGHRPVPKDITIEADVAEHVLSDLESVEALGNQVPFNCPGCGGVLWQMAEGDALRYRCHTGHSFTAPVLLAEQATKIEESLWVVLRMLEERRNLLVTMSKYPVEKRRKSKPPDAGNRVIFALAAKRAEEAQAHIQRIRDLLESGEWARAA